MKKYIAKTAISVSVTLPKGGNAQIPFSPLSDGTSVYYTDDNEIQWALEHHYKFGKLFRLVDVDPISVKTSTSGKPMRKNIRTSKKNTPTEMPDEEVATPGEESHEAAPALKEVEVTDLDSAKDYLAENHDVVRTKLKSEDIIKETALSHGITFKFV